MKIIDDFLNNITMYRLMLYYLLVLVLSAIILSFLKILPFEPLPFIFSTLFLMAVSWMTNKIFASVFKVSTNVESIYISALILTLIITPPSSIKGLPLLFGCAVLIAASKFILSFRKKHIFNPAAIALVTSSLLGLGGASWWVGTLVMMPQIIIGGILIVRKIRRWDLVLSFFTVAFLTMTIYEVMKGDSLLIMTRQIFFDSPILFFALVMLTEPQTTPGTKWRQIYYGGLVGFLFLNTTPEVALVLGNIFSYLVSPKEKLLLKLQEKNQLAPNIYDFVFGLDQRLAFLPGQYMEWTLSQKNPDSRGSRRYFTLASSPTENNLRIGVKFSLDGSSWKKTLLAMRTNQQIVAGGLSGEFNLPKDQSQKLVFIAGGIGVTPYRSMIKYLLDIKEKRDIILFYAVKTADEFVYRNIFDQAKQQLGIKTIYIAADRDSLLDAKKISKDVPDFKERLFYISGPHSMVDVFEKTLQQMGLKKSQIKTDYFPGYA